MAEEVNDPTAPGWKQDPIGRFAGRYWDGSDWTEHVVDSDRTRSLDPMSAETQPIRPASAQEVTAGLAPVNQSPAGPPPRRREWPLWTRVALAVAVVVVAAAAGLSSDDEPGSSGQPSATAGPPSSFAVGETARTGDFDVTVYGFRDPEPPGQFLRPQAGMHFVSVDVQVANPMPTLQEFSSLLGFHLLDGSNRQFNLTFNDITPGPPEGAIPAGQAIRGLVVFEIPDGATGFRFQVQGSLTASEVLFTLR